MDRVVCRGRVSGCVTPPSSKSYAQRALAAALLAEGRSVLRNIDFCDDTLSAITCIEALGAKVERTAADVVTIYGGLKPASGVLHVGESGLATRLFTPIAALCSHPITIEGRGTLLHRPMTMMIEPLRALGVDVRDGGGYLPIEVCGPMCRDYVEVDGSVSSQFITGLLMALPCKESDTVIRVSGATSRPYLDMTISTAEQFGVEIEHNNYEEFFVRGSQRYRAVDIAIEGDWSGAASLMVAGAIAGEVTVKNISMLSRQADVAITTALVRAGAEVISDDVGVTVRQRPLRAFEFDATDSPDLFPVLAALAAACEGESIIYGTHRLEHKESNRAEAIRAEYAKLGVEVELDGDMMRIRGGRVRGGREVETYGDHRMAMSLALTALRADEPITVCGAECVAKSYPDFFEMLDKIRVE